MRWSALSWCMFLGVLTAADRVEHGKALRAIAAQTSSTLAEGWADQKKVDAARAVQTQWMPGSGPSMAQLGHSPDPWAHASLVVAPLPTPPASALQALDRAHLPHLRRDAAWVAAQLKTHPQQAMGLLTWHPDAQESGGGHWTLAGTLPNDAVHQVAAVLQDMTRAKAWRAAHAFPEPLPDAMRSRRWFPMPTASVSAWQQVPFWVQSLLIIWTLSSSLYALKISIRITMDHEWANWVSVPMPTAAVFMVSVLAPSVWFAGLAALSFMGWAAWSEGPFWALCAYLAPWWVAGVGVAVALMLVALLPALVSQRQAWRRFSPVLSMGFSMALMQGLSHLNLAPWMPGFQADGTLMVEALHQGRLAPPWALGLGVLASSAVVGLLALKGLVWATGRRRQGWVFS